MTWDDDILGGLKRGWETIGETPTMLYVLKKDGTQEEMPVVMPGDAGPMGILGWVRHIISHKMNLIQEVALVANVVEVDENDVVPVEENKKGDGLMVIFESRDKRSSRVLKIVDGHLLVEQPSRRDKAGFTLGLYTIEPDLGVMYA
jgi:hypothetical protein